MVDRNQSENGKRNESVVNDVPIFSRPKVRNVNMFENDERKPPRRRSVNPLLAAGLILGLAAGAVLLVYMVALGLNWLLSKDNGPKLSFKSDNYLQLCTFEGFDAEKDANELKDLLSSEGNSMLLVRGFKNNSLKKAVLLGPFHPGEEAVAKEIYQKFKERFPDLKFKEVPRK